MTEQIELIFERAPHLSNSWQAKKPNGEMLVVAGKAGYVGRLVKSLWPSVRVGFKASDFGPALAAECARQGYGNTLWLK